MKSMLSIVILAAVVALAAVPAAAARPISDSGDATVGSPAGVAPRRPVAAPGGDEATMASPLKEPATAPAAKEPAAGAESPAAPAEAGPKLKISVEELKNIYKESPLIVQFQAENVQAKPDISPRLSWEVRGPVLETIKGSLLPGRISLHVDSVVRVFDLPRSDIEGKQFIAGIKPMSDSSDRRFQLVGQYAFLVDSNEAKALRQMAETDVPKGAGSVTLELVVRPIEKVFSVTGPKTIEIRLTNAGSDSATYIQAPLREKDGKLYLTAQGMLRIRDITGNLVPDKGNVMQGQAPPPPTTPAVILPRASFVETVDLGKFFQLSEGRYTLSMALATPDGRSRIASNGFTFQVGAVNLSEAPATAATEAAPPPPEAPGETATTAKSPAELAPKAGVATAPLTPRNAKPAAEKPAAPALPDPQKYQPGKSMSGVAALLRPLKAKYAVGEPIDLEFRLINMGPRSLAVDARLERTLTLQVQSVGDSPQPLVIRQVIPWPADAAATPEERSYLREGAFWGRTINLNTLYGKSLDEFPAPTSEEIAAGKGITYERFGKNLFGFPKPGVYTVTATYAVARPKAVEGASPADQQHREWWVGDLQTNPITIQVGESAK